MANYVKFMRGTPKAYQQLESKNENTLYFITEADALSGRLYLGDKEIVCTNGAETASYLKNLLDVSIPEDLSQLLDGQVLTYDVELEKWIPKYPAAVSEVLFDSAQFENNQDSQLSILGFANAPSGASLIKNVDGTLSWIISEVTTEDIQEIINKFDDYSTTEEIATQISAALADANHLSYKTVNSTDEIDLNDSSYIYLVKNGDTYDEYMVIEGTLELIGSLNVDLSDYATKTEVTTISTQVEDLASQLNTSSSEIETIKNNIANIDTTVSNLSTSLDTVSSKVDNLESSLNTVKTSVEQNTSNITALQEALASKLDISTFEEKMTEVDTELDALKTAMTWTNLPETEE